MTLKERDQEKIRDFQLKKELENKNKEKTKKEEMEKHLKDMHEKHEKSLNRANSVHVMAKLNKSLSQKNYQYIKMDNDFKESELQRKKVYEQLAKEKIQKRREQFLKPIDFQEISEFKKQHDQKIEELRVQKSKERIERFHNIQVLNSQIVKPAESESLKNFKKEFEDNFNKEKKIKEEKDLKVLKIRNFGKIVKENMTPSINEYKKKERESKFMKPKYEYRKKIKNPYNKYTVKLKKKLNHTGLNLSYCNSVASAERPHTARSKNRKKFFMEHYNVLNNRPVSAEIDALYPNKTILHNQSSAKHLPPKRISMNKLPNYLVELKLKRSSQNLSSLSLIKSNTKEFKDNKDGPEEEKTIESKHLFYYTSQ